MEAGKSCISGDIERKTDAKEIENTRYEVDQLKLLITETNTAALNETDKIVFTVEGSTPTDVIPSSGLKSTANTIP